MTKMATVHAQQQWEYLELSRKTVHYLVGELNDIGQEGWELVTLMQTKDRKGETVWTAILKRPFVAHGAIPKRSGAAPTAQVQAPKPPRLEPSGVEADFELEEPEPPPPPPKPPQPASEED